MIINNNKIKNKINENSKDKKRIKKVMLSFISGGIIGLIGQLFFVIFNNLIKFNETNSSLFSSAIIVIISVALTCFGIFDKLICYSYCGLIIPISGFANSITSSALEGKSEGIIFGIGSKIFSLIGSVCTYGIVSSMILGFIYYIYWVIINA